MRWFKPNLRNSIYGLLGHSALPSDTAFEAAMEDIREAMLDLLDADIIQAHPQLVRRLRYATDVQALWYLRGDLMAVLAGARGEAQARKELQGISRMFRGLLPTSIPVPAR